MNSSDPYLRSMALFEAAKGALVLLAGAGLLSLVHWKAQAVAEALVRHLHLNPASRYPRIFLDLATQATSARLWGLAALACGYAGLRFAEAWGLWWQRRWAEWLAALSGGIYLPLELYGLWQRPGWPELGLVVLNAAIVGYVVRLLWCRRDDTA
ncbi:DUF2127 domain-containing protein [Chitiniphilus eburneus]|uniref:DUF2127 domain-containing protein n=1 Tax=Chitiniphilus eburneus TaxID=2571148 RepID=A0A4U0Q8M6_9NEIS|nr:DUF2127 domain-containing protein [Chitiniphilus eburneus]TJZ77596.1 DUF2127 domain-containing protein [Chitiniphilus eburneus]